jgi:hypothetical protein
MFDETKDVGAAGADNAVIATEFAEIPGVESS